MINSSPSQNKDKIVPQIKKTNPFHRHKLIINLVGVLLLTIWLFNFKVLNREKQPLPHSSSDSVPKNSLDGTQPLIMKGGDPYIRALMRTITASEANDPKPYFLIYGGKYVSDLSNHPELCVPIVAGPNVGRCTTAAGRYQFINTTWYEKSKRYHPKVVNFLWWKSYSFEPEYQDAVVHSWLSDSQAWGVDISKLLRQGKIEEVLRLLSPTWTSLGYGIESNSMSKHLPNIYQRMLQEELG